MECDLNELRSQKALDWGASTLEITGISIKPTRSNPKVGLKKATHLTLLQIGLSKTEFQQL